MQLLLIFFLLHVAHSADHSLTVFASTGLPDHRDFMMVTLIDGVQQGYCGKNKTEDLKAWIESLTGENTTKWRNQTCTLKYFLLSDLLDEIMSRSNRAGGVHVLQEISGCRVDGNMKVTAKFDKFIYNRGDFMSLNMNSKTWGYTEYGSTFTNQWKRMDYEPEFINNVLLVACEQILMEYLKNGNNSLHREDPPSVSLLRQSPSSPVSCHATGFYTTRVQMFWRKDGEEIHEDVNQREILPNQDGTFQMRVDLKISPDEEWSRYECVFQLSDETNSTVLRLDPAALRTTSKNPTNTTVVVTILAVLVVLCVLAAVGFVVYRKKALDSGPEPHNSD